jgi:chromosome partitioning protein
VTRVIAVANQKGGVGKTTTTVNLGAALAGLGHRTLLLDLDPQANATLLAGVDPYDRLETIFHVLVRGVPLQKIVVPSTVEGLDVAPSHIDLAGAEGELMSTTGREQVLREALEPVLGDYAFVLIDCQPSLGILVVNALSAAEEVVVPVEAGVFAFMGFQQLEETIRLIQRRVNRRLKIAGLLVTKMDGRTTNARGFLERLPVALDGRYRLFDSHIGHTTRMKDAETRGEIIVRSDPRSQAAMGYVQLAQELLRGK